MVVIFKNSTRKLVLIVKEKCAALGTQEYGIHSNDKCLQHDCIGDSISELEGSLCT